MESLGTCALCNSFGSNDGNCVPNTDEAKKNHARIHFTQSRILDDGITADEILQRCFLFRQPKKEATGLSQIECRQSLRDLCNSLIKHQSKIDTVVCNMCGSQGQKTDFMIGHACAHLEGKFFKCRHCDRSSSTRHNILLHIRRVHNRESTSEDFEDKAVEHFDEISNSIRRCFSTDYPRATGRQQQFAIRSNCRDKSQRSVVHLCRSIFIQRSKPKNLECNLCGFQISLRGHPFKAMAMYQHAATHLEVKLFTCRHCNQPMSTKGGMMGHLKKLHQIVNGNSDDFDDQSKKFHSEYLNMIERCFSAGQVKLEMPSTIKKRVIRTRIRTNRSNLHNERHLFCTRLTRRIIDSDGKFQCSLCSKRLSARSSGNVDSTAALSHVEMHLQKPLYRCKVCERRFNTQPTLILHLSTKHALRMEKNHECTTDEYHEEIMAMLAKCFAPEGMINE